MKRGKKAGKRDDAVNIIDASEAIQWADDAAPPEVAPYSAPPPAAEKRLTVVDIRKMKGKAKIACLTSYDFPTAAIVDESGIDAVLVGDSVGNVVMGLEDTLSVTMDAMVHHTRAVAKGLKRALLIGDLPFMSYQVTEADALRNAGRLVQEGGAQCVKLEGGSSMARTVRRLIECGIPVMGHIGLTPQSVHAMGGYRMQGKTDEDRNRILDDALALQDAGCFAVVLECVEAEFTARVTKTLAIPTIGIGSGEACDGQILVVHDMLGYTVRSVPRFVKQRADLRRTMGDAIKAYVREVKGD